ncbi:hypothetical protein ACFQWB_01185 [Paenibacillus thermoaerophilus]|uniref:YtkA-like n=1 Tax=Paenibacillus thermoaerophilus TaxID=1215385 RepID=A0ABW2V2Q3_9BACL|nr:hypothetical protein [Paenibacillus thermoaerophilus]TMV18980.1 hypothetical protein FE781_00210 [Paenibacillus thermoaerophilus]
MNKTAAALVLLAMLVAACGKGEANPSAVRADGHAGRHADGHGAGHEGHGDAGARIQADQVSAVWTLADGSKPQANRETAIRIELSAAGRPIEQFDTVHEEKQHLIIVSKDLSFFRHVHPEFKGQGVFEISTVFPRGGQYKLIADFVPTGGSAMTKTEWVSVEGEQAAAEPLRPDASLAKTADGKRIELSFDRLEAGRETTLVFTLKDERTQAPITDLQPYLGAVGHVVILSGDAERYLHVHPIDERASGPEARFATTFPESGVYKLWGQFKHNGEVVTVSFVVRVP